MFLNFFKRAVSFQNNNSGEKKEEMEVAKEALAVEESEEQTVFKETIYDIIRTIKDPEKPATLEFLQVVYEEGVYILPRKSKKDPLYVEIEFNPTVPHCSLANLIGLCIRAKLKQCLPEPIKLKIYIKKGAHDTEKEINKLINDKERVAAAMENPNLREIVEKCIKEDDY